MVTNHIGKTKDELNGMSFTSIVVLVTWIRNQLLTAAIHLSVCLKSTMRSMSHQPALSSNTYKRRHRMVIN